ncbi:ornithine carbamoyltransferase, partial [Candidatus Hakubella thermalkaliphila]
MERKKKKDLLGLKDLSGQEIEEIISWAEKMKENSKRGVEEQFLKGKCIALLFTKPSTRTQVSFEVAKALFLMTSRSPGWPTSA